MRAPTELRVRFLTWVRVLGWAAVSAGFISAQFVGHPATLGDWVLLLVAGILVAVPVVLASHREYVRQGEVRSATVLAAEYEARLAVTLGDAVTPIADLLGRINLASGPEQARLQGQLRQLVVDAAAELCGSERTRSVFFALHDGRMRPDAWAGRSDPPTTVFVEGTAQGKGAHSIVKSHSRLLVRDVRRAPRGVKVRRDAGYRTFLAVAVYAGDRNFGLLTVDAPEPGALTDRDLDVTAALAQILGAGLAASIDSWSSCNKGHREVPRK